MYIAICDDDPTVYPEMMTYIRAALSHQEEPVRFCTYPSAEAFLADTQNFDILFIDVYMEQISGVEAVSRMKKDRAKCVVFMTTSHEHAIDAFRLGAKHYLVKPIVEAEVRAAIERCEKDLHALQEETLIFSASSGTIVLPYSSILYLEACNKRVMIYTEYESYTSYASLDTFGEKLNADIFMRAQRSFIVHMGKITNFFSDHLVLTNGMEISLSRARQDALKQQYFAYLFRLARGAK